MTAAVPITKFLSTLKWGGERKFERGGEGDFRAGGTGCGIWVWREDIAPCGVSRPESWLSGLAPGPPPKVLRLSLNAPRHLLAHILGA